VIAFSDRGALRSKTELDKLGYKVDTLPRAMVCYRMNDANNDVQYVKLYDPSTLERKRQNPRRVVHYVEALYWPVAWMDVFAHLNEDEQERGAPMSAREWNERVRPIAGMASSLLFYAREEIEAFAGETVEFKLPVMPVRVSWPNVGMANKQLDDLIKRLVSCYRTWKYPPMTDEEWTVFRAEAAVKAKRAFEILSQEMPQNAARYALPDWVVTTDEALPPAVQLNLFDEKEV
jgi:hypothetical protein